MRTLRALSVILAFFISINIQATETEEQSIETVLDRSGMQWEPEIEEIIESDDFLGEDIVAQDSSIFDENEGYTGDQALEWDNEELTGESFALRKKRRKNIQKKRVDQFLTKTCGKIQAAVSKGKFKKLRVKKATQYFTPLFTPGRNGQLQRKDRRACINIEGSCLVGDYLYNWAGRGKPWGKRYDRRSVAFKFGKGNGKSYYNKTNALDPCRTLAADQKKYKAGTVIYIPSMRNKVCPQTGKKVDGCFIVGDVGSAIKGWHRFDIFTGECANYSKRSNTCRDSGNRNFTAPKGTHYYVIGRHNILAKELRTEADMFINQDWRNSLFPF